MVILRNFRILTMAPETEITPSPIIIGNLAEHGVIRGGGAYLYFQ